MQRPEMSADRLAGYIKAMRQVYKFPMPDNQDSVSWSPPPASSGHQGRYLWTDAFGLVNFLTLYRVTGHPTYLGYATSLAKAVHDILGRTRDGSARLPGASDANPVGGGLRIGKEEESGPDGDGQYHHYLTLWMFGLNRLAIAYSQHPEPKERDQATIWNNHGIRLMEAIHPAFVYDRDSIRPRIYWKVSTDLEKPLVRSEGNLDPVDGLSICKLLRDFAIKTNGEYDVLSSELNDYKKIVAMKWEGYTSRDPLDLGMTLWTAQLHKDETWAKGLLDRATRDLRRLVASAYFDGLTTNDRLAFREFGTVLGMRCALADDSSWVQEADEILDAWEEAGVEPGASGLKPITLVMYAAAIEPGAFRRQCLEGTDHWSWRGV